MNVLISTASFMTVFVLIVGIILFLSLFFLFFVFVCSFFNSIANLVTLEKVTLSKTNANLTNHSSVDFTATITIPSGYKVLDYYTRHYTGVTDISRLDLNGTTLSVKGWNHTGQTQSNVYIYVGVLYIRDI